MKNIHIFLFLCILLAALSGCQTTRAHKDEMTQMSSRIKTLEATVEQRDQEIMKLQDQIDTISYKKSVKPAPTQPVPETKDHLGIIRVSASVNDVQKALKEAGYYKGNVDGKIGPNTIAAIAAFQKAQGLKADSIIGPKTWEALKVYLK